MGIQDKYSPIFKLLLLLTSTIALYWKNIYIVFNEAIFSDFASHILAIPFMLIYIIYRLRHILLANISNNNNTIEFLGVLPIKDILGLVLCSFGFFLKIYGSYTFFPLEFHIISLPIFLSGLVILIYNIDTMRTLLFPIMFLVLLIPPPSTFTQIIGSFLSTLSSQIAYSSTKLLGLPVELVFEYGSPMIVLTTISGQEISLAVDLACSGLYSLIGFTIFSIFIAYITRESLTKKALVVSLGFPLIYFLNVFRIVVIVIIAFYFGPTLALDIFHVFGGWALIFVGVVILFSLSERVLKIRLFRKKRIDCDHDESYLDTCTKCGQVLRFSQIHLSNYFQVKSILIFLVIIILLTIQVPVFVFSEKGAEVSSLGLSSETPGTILPKINGYELDFSYRDSEFERISGQDASLMYMYRPDNHSKPIIWVGLEIGKTKAILHSWEGCLITWPSFQGEEVKVTQLDLRDIRLNENPPLTARYFAYYWHNSLEAQVVLYWYTASVFQTPNGFQEKYVKISVIEYPVEPSYFQTAEIDIHPIAQEIANYWEPTNKWTQMALIIAKNGSTLLFFILSTFVGISAYIIILQRNRRKKIMTLISRLEDPLEKDLLEILSKDHVVKTLPVLTSKLKKVQNSLDGNIIYEKLTQAEKTGLVKRKISNIHDDPYLSWELF
ncbi:MAG: exosortase/archaeosortase family protein [Candidatus Hodarchaeales archaeon]|jgi:exosortase/archaeosortase family protein